MITWTPSVLSCNNCYACQMFSYIEMPHRIPLFTDSQLPESSSLVIRVAYSAMLLPGIIQAKWDPSFLPNTEIHVASNFATLRPAKVEFCNNFWFLVINVARVKLIRHLETPQTYRGLRYQVWSRSRK